MASSRQEKRQTWERNFRATHGVSSGTYYAMRRNAADRGISPKTFDKVASNDGYSAAKGIAQTAATDIAAARYEAGRRLGVVAKGDYFYDGWDGFEYDWPDDYDWWYH